MVLVRVDTSLAAPTGTPEWSARFDEGYGLVQRMMHQRMTQNARNREDIEYGDFDAPFQPGSDDWESGAYMVHHMGFYDEA